jgi:polyhydroxybutyrate depolymerase
MTLGCAHTIDPALGASCDPDPCVALADGGQECDNRIQPYHPSLFTRLSFQGRNRSYMAHVPPCAADAGAMPVVLNFHGGGGNGETAEIAYGLNRKAETHCFIAVHPNGTPSEAGSDGRLQYWNGGDALSIKEIDQTADDVGFIRAVIADLSARHPVDRKRIFATGISNGAWMVQRLACEASDLVAAIAPVAGGLAVSTCAPPRPVPVIHFHGTADPGWPFEGGAACFTDTQRTPAREVVAGWRARNGCGADPASSDSHGAAQCDTWSCAAGSEVRFCVIEGGGHTVPGGCAFPIEQRAAWDSDCALGKGRGVGVVTADIDAVDEAWKFFQRHPMP